MKCKFDKDGSLLALRKGVFKLQRCSVSQHRCGDWCIGLNENNEIVEDCFGEKHEIVEDERG